MYWQSRNFHSSAEFRMYSGSHSTSYHTYQKLWIVIHILLNIPPKTSLSTNCQNLVANQPICSIYTYFFRFLRLGSAPQPGPSPKIITSSDLLPLSPPHPPCLRKLAVPCISTFDVTGKASWKGVLVLCTALYVKYSLVSNQPAQGQY